MHSSVYTRVIVQTSVKVFDVIVLIDLLSTVFHSKHDAQFLKFIYDNLELFGEFRLDSLYTA